MSHELIYLGPGPADERLAQTTQADFARRNKAECLAYLQAIRRVCGDPPAGAALRIQAGARLVARGHSPAATRSDARSVS